MLSIYRTPLVVVGRRSAQLQQQRIYHFSKSTSKSVRTDAPLLAESSFSKLGNWPKEHPFLFQLGIATAKTSGADLIVQVRSWEWYCKCLQLRKVRGA